MEKTGWEKTGEEKTGGEKTGEEKTGGEKTGHRTVIIATWRFEPRSVCSACSMCCCIFLNGNVFVMCCSDLQLKFIFSEADVTRMRFPC